jgi:hypothetical protein
VSVKSPAQREPRNAPIWIKVFVVIHIVAVTMWALPHPPKQYKQGTATFGIRTDGPGPFLQSTRDLIADGTLYFNEEFLKTSPLKFYVLTTGFWQYWDMFSPDPAATDFYCDADVVYKDGTVKLYQYPRVYTMPIPEKYFKERYRKFFERANDNSKKHIWPFFGQHIAQINYTDPNNPPVQVRVRRHWLPIAPPGKKQQEEYNEYIYFVWNVDQVALAKHEQIHDYTLQLRGDDLPVEGSSIR